MLAVVKFSRNGVPKSVSGKEGRKGKGKERKRKGRGKGRSKGKGREDMEKEERKCRVTPPTLA